jgi:hypothetical protein
MRVVSGSFGKSEGHPPPLALLLALLCFAWDTHAKVVGGSQFLLLLLLDARSLRI